MSTQNTAPDFGEPWHKQTALMNKGVHWLNTNQFNRAVVCVNACAGMADPNNNPDPIPSRVTGTPDNHTEPSPDKVNH